jgi:hypothetical protein
MADEITLGDILALLDKSYTLTYANQGESLDNDLEAIQEAIHQQEMQPIWEVLGEWERNGEEYGLDYAIDELKNTIENEWEFDEPEIEVQDLIDKYEDEIKDTILERDDSTYADDVVRATSDPVVFYDTGIEIPYGACFDKEEFLEAIRTLKEALNIPKRSKKWDEQLEELIANASYGGMVVIYFRDEVNKLVKTEGVNWIKFTNPEVAIIDMLNGSGHNVTFDKVKVTYPFNPKNLFIDKLFKYSYVYKVCGMSSSFCDSTRVEYSKDPHPDKETLPDSELHTYLDMEAQYNKIFKEGKCTRGDMDWNRHRRKQYINEYPCGTHCLDCGNFWVD